MPLRISYCEALDLWIARGGVFDLCIGHLSLVGSEMDGSPLDVKVYYSADAAYDLVEFYGAEGRRFYARTALPVDVLYPSRIACSFRFG